MARLLLRFGISAGSGRPKAGHRDGYTLDVYGAEDQLRFLRGRSGCTARAAAAAALLEERQQPSRRNTNVDTVPREVWDRVRDVLADRGMTAPRVRGGDRHRVRGSTMWKHAPSRQRMARVAAVLDDADLELLATNDVFWDEVVVDRARR